MAQGQKKETLKLNTVSGNCTPLSGSMVPVSQGHGAQNQELNHSKKDVDNLCH